MIARQTPFAITRSTRRPAVSKAWRRSSTASSRKPLAMRRPPPLSERARSTDRRARVRPLMLATMRSNVSAPAASSVPSRGSTIGETPLIRRVLRRRLHGLRVGVEREDARGAELGGGDGEDAGAATEVEHGHAGPHEFFEGAQAHRRRRVLAGAERHAGVDLDDRLAALELVRDPGGADDQGAADALDAEVLLPGVTPGCLAKAADAPPLRRRL